MAYRALPDQNQSEDFTAIVDPPQMKKLKYQDIGGYHEMLTDFIQTTEVYDIPKAPMLDPGQWVDAHFKEVTTVMLCHCVTLCNMLFSWLLFKLPARCTSTQRGLR